MRRAAAVLLAATVAALAVASRARSQPSGQPASAPATDQPIGFDHIIHAGRVDAGAVPQPACTRCHPADARGRLGAPGHAACFGDCHGAPPARAGRPVTTPPERQPVCTACHRPSEIERLSRAGARAPARPVPPRTVASDGDFAIALSHAAHARAPRGCRSCHAVPPAAGAARPARTGSGHPRCAACHTGKDGAPFAMARCTSCHTPAVGPARAPHAIAGRFPVAQRFSHASHLARVRGGGDPCAGCHAGAAAARGDLVPSPTKPDCASCHDGRAAFSMTEAACRRCHTPPPAGAEAEADDDDTAAHRIAARAAFSHASHLRTACAGCHGITKSGEPGPVGSAHQPCADSGCHADDFGAARPRICTTCHVREEPWRDLHLDPQPAGPSDFQVGFSHRSHLVGAAPRTDAPCARCHLAQQDGRFAPAGGHGSCAGAGCHTVSASPAPALGDCGACHQAAGAGRSRADRWSVRARFTHTPHRTEPGAPDRSIACTQCHGGVLEATSVAAVPAPPKRACARCHDGGAAFKLTGHGCARCHTPSRSERPQAPGVERAGQRDRGQRPPAQQP